MTGLTSMSQAESPESEIGCRVRYATQAILNCMDRLVDEYLAKFKLKHVKSDYELRLEIQKL